MGLGQVLWKWFTYCKSWVGTEWVYFTFLPWFLWIVNHYSMWFSSVILWDSSDVFVLWWLEWDWIVLAPIFDSLVTSWWNCLKRIRSSDLVREGESLRTGLEISKTNLSFSFCLVIVPQDISSQALLQPACLPPWLPPWKSQTVTI